VRLNSSGYGEQSIFEWLDLLARWKQFAPYKQDVTKMNVHGRLLKLA
jgi:hypothetical protein